MRIIVLFVCLSSFLLTKVQAKGKLDSLFFQFEIKHSVGSSFSLNRYGYLGTYYQPGAYYKPFQLRFSIGERLRINYGAMFFFHSYNTEAIKSEMHDNDFVPGGFGGAKRLFTRLVFHSIEQALPLNERTKE